MVAKAMAHRYICHHGGQRVECDDGILAQIMANPALVRDRINPSGIDHQAAGNPMIFGMAVMVVQKRVEQRCSCSQVPNGQ